MSEEFMSKLQAFSESAAEWARTGLVWLIILAACFFVLVVLLSWTRDRLTFLFPKTSSLRDFPSPPPPKGEPLDRTLVIVAHGLGPWGQNHIRHIAKLAAKPGTTVWVLRYDLNIWTNQDHYWLSRDIAEKIQARWQEDGGETFDRIVLCGHSCGALLIRSAYLYAADERYRQMNPEHAPSETAFDWHKSVDRLVLLAGVNAGWNRNFNTILGVSPLGLAASLSRACKISRTAYDIERGTIFIERLRLAQLHHLQLVEASGGELSFPQVVQIVGTKDTLVDARTEMDLAVMGSRTNFLLVNDATHRSIVYVNPDPDASDLEAPGSAAASKAMITEAVYFALFDKLGEASRALPPAVHAEWHTPKWILQSLIEPQKKIIQDKRIQRAVVVLHGIRDDGHWAERFRLFIEERFRGHDIHYLNEAGPETGSTEDEDYVMVLSPSFGRFSIANFLLPGFNRREFPLRWFARTCVDIRAQYPHVEKIDFIGHSFGTFVFGNFLKRYRLPIPFGNVYLAGSVLPRNFPWDEVLSRPVGGNVRPVEALANATADGDVIVAFGPSSHQAATVAINAIPGISFTRVLGDAGVVGFDTKSVTYTTGDISEPMEIERIDSLSGGHGAFSETSEAILLASEFVCNGASADFEKIKATILEKQSTKHDGHHLSKLTRWVHSKSVLVLLLVFVLFVLIAGLVYVMTFVFLPIIPDPLLVAIPIAFFTYLLLDRF
ncbi:MAG: hypothetical protein CMK09_04960 [Ponticaulis sp.]|nr:hypothetical protein [Ponticaulis sp.]|tara:strand:- start:36305 stop:38464 length:2160 start_codon:yes stop_codon:yes gene_type:complete